MNILLAVDGSEQAAAAVQAVSARPWPLGSNVRVLSVVEVAGPPPVGEFIVQGADLDQLRAQQNEQAEKLTHAAAAELEKAGLSVEETIREGSPGSTIVDEAKDWPADLIVMGTHGYTGLKKLMLGSVAQSVVSHAPCSVEVVRDRMAVEVEKAA